MNFADKGMEVIELRKQAAAAERGMNLPEAFRLLEMSAELERKNIREIGIRINIATSLLKLYTSSLADTKTTIFNIRRLAQGGCAMSREKNHALPTSEELATAARVVKFVWMCIKATSESQVRRLWNWADHQDHPEMYWEILFDLCEWACEGGER